ncbi:germination protein YpeB [Paenibacillus sp. FSL L8-0493]|jgi:spore germination protein|uniref:Germination protein YpeB n=1 Tax=Paenibacillus odorifer TaxID=189426 RepID=A0A1R0WXL0_9BACL|nr:MULTISPECIES: germination protein YpeB [Paenibacillus]MDH6427677.1 spore germination protein [Paenibacillus sp. PastH-4]MDH6444698.1 spore germination protein [Paenibacillus sp. PastF-4]MDH6528594.1 spore germination protein [Paenibacillus sp. PastH-3]OMC73393.1 germination protein YpeB [Paenibacillus odorifer]OMC74377.1 germination protein YpeB [Paenibacillus odorifer]
MYKRLSAVMFPLTALLLIGALVWGYQENQEKNSILIKAENQYQRAFHDLSYHVDRLHGELGNTLAVNSASNGMHRKGLVNVWRMTSEAQNEINQLPLTLLPFSKTEEFLSKISNFSYKAGIRDFTKKPLTDGELSNLKALYKNSGEISKDLQEVQNKVIGNRLRWMDVETALATENKAEDNTIIDGFKTVDKRVGAYPELDWGPSVASIYDKRSVKMLGGTPVTAEDIKRKALKFADAGSNAKVDVKENGKNTEWPSYTATVSASNKKHTISMDFTKNGGLLISYYDNREVGPAKVSIKEAVTKAEQFLEKKGYPHMTAVSADRYDNIGNLTFVTKQNDVLIYPEKMTIRMGLDTGDTIGFEASEYVNEHKDNRKLPKPKLTLAEARKFLNSDFKEQYNRLSWIKNDDSVEVLTYEFGGGVNGSKYRIYINAEDGIEESVEEIRPSSGSEAK